MIRVRLTTATAVAMSLGLSLPIFAQSTEPTTQIDLPAQPLAQAIQAVARQASINILVDPRLVEGREAPAVKAEMSIQQVLSLLLQGTGLTSRYVDDKTITLVAIPAPIATKTSADGFQMGAANLRLALNTQNAEQERTEIGQEHTEIEQVIVTAQKVRENMQSVPVPITAVSAEVLEASGVKSTEDLQMLVPGLTFADSQGQAAPSIRGVGTTETIGGNESPVSTYLDGVYLGSASAVIRSLNNIEQVAVLKGPQGTLFGRNATGGLIQITTPDPAFDLGGHISGSYASKDTVGGDLYLTGGFSDNLAADLSVSYEDQQDGFGTNLTTGSDVLNGREFAARTKLLYEAEDTTVRFSVDYADSHRVQSSHPIAGTPAQPVGFGPLVAPIFFSGGPFDMDADIDQLIDSTDKGVALNIDHVLPESEFTLTSITAYRESESDAIFDADYTANAVYGSSTFTTATRDEQITQEFQVASDRTRRFNWTAGAFFYGADNNYDLGFLYGPVALSDNAMLQRVRSYAAFGQGRYAFTPRTALTLGVRYTHEEREFEADLEEFGSSGFKKGSISYDSPTWRAVLEQTFAPEIMGFLSYDRGSKSGGFNLGGSDPGTPYDPETLDALQAGIKSDLLNRRLRLNLTGFYYFYKNIQLNTVVAGTNSIRNAGRAEVYGFDADFVAVPAQGLMVTLGTALNFGGFSDYEGALLTVRNPDGTLGEIEDTDGSLTNGNRLPQAPRWSFNGTVRYEREVPIGELDLSATYFYSSDWFAQPENRLRNPAYDLINASAALHFGASRKFVIRLSGENLADEVHFTNFNPSRWADAVMVAPGRLYRATVEVKF